MKQRGTNTKHYINLQSVMTGLASSVEKSLGLTDWAHLLTLKHGKCAVKLTQLFQTSSKTVFRSDRRLLLGAEMLQCQRPLKRRIILIGLFRFYAFFVLVTLRPHNRPSVFDTDYLYSTIYTGYNVHKEKLF